MLCYLLLIISSQMAAWQPGLATFWTLKLHSGLFLWTVTFRKKTVRKQILWNCLTSLNCSGWTFKGLEGCMGRPMKKLLVMLHRSFSMKFRSTASKDTSLWHCATTALCCPLTTPGREQQLSLSIYIMLLLGCEWAIISTGALRETSALLTGNIFQLLCTFYSIFQTRVWFWKSWCFADGVLRNPLPSFSKLESYGTSCCYKSLIKSCRGLITTIAILATSTVRMFVLSAG